LIGKFAHFRNDLPERYRDRLRILLTAFYVLRIFEAMSSDALIATVSLFLFACQPPALTTRPPHLRVDPPRVEVSVLEKTAAAGIAPPSNPTPRSEPSPAPVTWTTLYERYFGPDSDAGCGRSRSCHADVMTDSDAAYTWLVERGYVAGTQSPLVSKTNSCLRWFGGNMPPRGTPNETAVRDLTAWVAAGAVRN
jgi:hypothetical protein